MGSAIIYYGTCATHRGVSGTAAPLHLRYNSATASLIEPPYRSVAPPLQLLYSFRYSSVTAPMQLRYSSITALLQLRCTSVTAPSQLPIQLRCSSVTAPLRLRYGSVAAPLQLPLQLSYTAPLQLRYTLVSCYGSVTAPRQIRYSSAPFRCSFCHKPRYRRASPSNPIVHVVEDLGSCVPSSTLRFGVEELWKGTQAL